jgi:hypothetical protein
MMINLVIFTRTRIHNDTPPQTTRDFSDGERGDTFRALESKRAVLARQLHAAERMQAGQLASPAANHVGSSTLSYAGMHPSARVLQCCHAGRDADARGWFVLLSQRCARH